MSEPMPNAIAELLAECRGSTYPPDSALVDAAEAEIARLRAERDALASELDTARELVKLKAGVCWVECPSYKVMNEGGNRMMFALLEAYREKREVWAQAEQVVQWRSLDGR